MKRVATALLLAGILTSFGCASQSANQEPVIPVQPVPEGICMPPWELAPPQSKNGIYASGEAKYSMPSLAKTTADDRARQAIARTLETKTAGVINNMQQENNVNGNITTLDFAENISKSISVHSLQNCEIVRRHVCPDGTFHSLAYYSYDAFKQQLEESVQQQQQQHPSAANDAAANAILSESAMDRLESQLDGAFQ